MSIHIPRFALRSSDAGRRLDLFLVCAVASVLGNRVFLIITGYPQLGNSTLHISHAIWGALMMVIAIVFAISFLAPSNRTFIAFIGGCGFGWFIDELGKFISRDTNYFFHPTIAIIYIVFIAMYLVFRGIQRRDLGPDEALLNGLEALKSAAIGDLSESRRTQAVLLLQSTGADAPLASEVRALLADQTGLPDSRPNWFERAARSIRVSYLGLATRAWFANVIVGVFALTAAGAAVTAVTLAADHDVIRGTSEWASAVSSIVAGALIVVGLLLVRRDRVTAYRWFERGILVEIFVTQVFEFDQQQLAAVLGLAISLVLWVSLRIMIRAEVEREFHVVEPQAAAS